MKIIIFGASGFLGTSLVESLLPHKHKIHIFVRNRKKLPPFFFHKNIYLYDLDILDLIENTADQDRVKGVLKNAEVVVNLIGTLVNTIGSKSGLFNKLHIKFVEFLVQNIPTQTKLVYISAYGVGKKIPTLYFKSKLMAEELIIKNVSNYSIIRPSLIWHNTKSLGFRSKIDQLLSYPIFAPILGKGDFFVNVVNIDVVVEGIKDAIIGEGYREIIEVKAPESVQFLDFVETYQKKQGLDKIIIFFPIFMLRPIVFLLSSVPKVKTLLPITDDQIIMLTRSFKD